MHNLDTAIESVTTFLLEKQSQEGWWPYKQAHQPSIEATCWSAISLRKNKKAQLAANYLVSIQNPDGGWSAIKDLGRSDWTSALALLTLRHLIDEPHPQTAPSNPTAMEISALHAVTHLVEARTDFYSPAAKALIFFLKGPYFLNHYTRGWPWTPKAFNWIEPTSYALLALKATHLAKDNLVKNALDRASEYMLNEMCLGGGWNYGNKDMLGANLPPYPVTTAQALCALQDHKEHEVVGKSMTYLSKKAPEHDTTMSLSWAILAKSAHQLSYKRELDLLFAHLNSNGNFGPSILHNALALCALQCETNDNPLKFDNLSNKEWL
jgi:hypothetical protein